MRILIIGGYGVFGGRLAQLLADEARLTLIIAGRSKPKAETFCAHFRGAAHVQAALFDRDGNAENQLAEIKPGLVVDATGPFQCYGLDPYRIVKACLSIGIDYMDFADGADFVKGISQYDEIAKRKNIFVLSGVSSFPVLSAAVIRHLARDLRKVRTIKAGIAPSPYAGVGFNVIRAIASYAGQPVKLVRNGRIATGNAFTESMRYTISPPGKLPLNGIRFSLVDVPDLQVLPELYPGLDSIWIGAGPVPEILLRALNGLAWLVQLKIIPSLLPFARIFYLVINTLRWGEHRGGMFVEIEGVTQDGEKARRSWHLLAEGNDGPFIPSMALEALIRKKCESKIPPPGARPALKDLELADYDSLFRRRTIYTGFREETKESARLTLYKRILGDAWNSLPPVLQAMHDLKENMSAEGTAIVERGTGWLSHAIASLFRFPKTGQNVPVKVDFRTYGNGELWRRTFGTKSFSSYQYEGQKKSRQLLCERFGPFTFGLALIVENQKLHLIIRNWDFFGLPLPLFLAPENDSYEFAENGIFHFHVKIGHTLTGLIVCYRGQLTICA